MFNIILPRNDMLFIPEKVGNGTNSFVPLDIKKPESWFQILNIVFISTPI